MIRLIRLTFVGAAVETASITFGPRLTLVRGPSDTGKSFIVDAIDFMLGSRSLKEIPEREAYSTILLTLEVGGERYTLSRSVTGGALGLYVGEHLTLPADPPARTLADRHSAENADNLSTWLLDDLDIAGARLRKNQQNATVSLSFRDLAHLTIIDETSMQAETPPALTGRYDTKTKEVAALKLLLENDDDSGLIESPSGREVRRLKGAKLEVIDQLIGAAEAQTVDLPGREEVLDQLARLSESIDQVTASMKSATEIRSAEAAALARDETRARAIRLRRGQIATLNARFNLLRQQYESDIQRLTLVIEGGRLLDLFESGPCPLCGAIEEHQNHDTIAGDQASIEVAAAADIERTQALLVDLDDTIDELANSEAALSASDTALAAQIRDRAETIRKLEESMRPGREEISVLLTKRGELEKSLATFAQLDELLRVRSQIEKESAAETAAAATALGVRTVARFSDAIRARLEAWGYPDADRVEYDRTVHDLKAGDQYRAAHGKGVRSILHAAFTVGLADYCISHSHPHPGFVVLDSPLVTYRAPGEEEAAGPDRDFATRFYHDMESSFAGQVIVMENTDPLEPLGDDVVDIRFTKDRTRGRYGFFAAID